MDFVINDYAIVLFLLIFIALQQLFFLRQIQKLVDKAMSRSFTEYIKATEPEPFKLKIPVDAPEDLTALNEFNG